jgi:hypothetical protein
LVRDGDAKLSARARERDALVERGSVLGSEIVQNPREVPRVLTELAELLLELVHLFDDEDRQDDGIVLEFVDC